MGDTPLILRPDRAPSGAIDLQCVLVEPSGRRVGIRAAGACGFDFKIGDEQVNIGDNLIPRMMKTGNHVLLLQVRMLHGRSSLHVGEVEEVVDPPSLNGRMGNYWSI